MCGSGRPFSSPACVCIGCHLLFFPICCGTVCLIQCDVTRCVNLVTSLQCHTDRFVTGVSYGIEIHAIAKAQYPHYRSPNGAEAFDKRDKGRILGRYQSGMDQIKGTARAKLGQSCFQCNRVVSTWSRTSGMVAACGRGFVSSYIDCRFPQTQSCYPYPPLTAPPNLPRVLMMMSFTCSCRNKIGDAAAHNASLLSA